MRRSEAILIATASAQLSNLAVLMPTDDPDLYMEYLLKEYRIDLSANLAEKLEAIRTEPVVAHSDYDSHSEHGRKIIELLESLSGLGE